MDNEYNVRHLGRFSGLNLTQKQIDQHNDVAIAKAIMEYWA